jgi:hypothetical protein
MVLISCSSTLGSSSATLLYPGFDNPLLLHGYDCALKNFRLDYACIPIRFFDGNTQPEGNGGFSILIFLFANISHPHLAAAFLPRS